MQYKNLRKYAQPLTISTIKGRKEAREINKNYNQSTFALNL